MLCAGAYARGRVKMRACQKLTYLRFCVIIVCAVSLMACRRAGGLLTAENQVCLPRFGEREMTEKTCEKIEYALGLISSGDEAGVDLLYACAGRAMLFVARSVVRDEAAAEDVVQDSFLKIVRGISRYKKGTNGYAWVCKIVRNTALNYLKSSGRRASVPLESVAELSDGGSGEERSAAKLLVERMLKSLSPPEVRQMIYMKYFLDMTVREIARELGKSKSYVSKEIIKAEKLMREML